MTKLVKSIYENVIEGNAPKVKEGVQNAPDASRAVTKVQTLLGLS